MNIVSAYSNKTSVCAAISELREQFKNLEAKLVVYFASSVYPPAELSQEMQAAFPDAVVFGCSTAGEIASGKMLKDSITAMAFNARAMTEVEVAVVENLQDEKGVARAFSGFETRFGMSMLDLNPKTYVGIVLVDGLSGAEE